MMTLHVTHNEKDNIYSQFFTPFFSEFCISFHKQINRRSEIFSVKCVTEIFHKACIFWKDVSSASLFNIDTFEIKVEQN